MLLVVAFPSFSNAQEVHNNYQGTWKDKVLEVTDEKMEQLFDREHLVQTMEIEIITGPEKGNVIIIENDFQKLQKGDVFYFNHNIFIDGENSYTVINVARHGALLFLLGVFVFAVIQLLKLFFLFLPRILNQIFLLNELFLFCSFFSPL